MAQGERARPPPPSLSARQQQDAEPDLADEEIFGWGKSVAGLRRTKMKGRRRTWDGGYLIMAAYNPTRMTRLLRVAAA